MASNTIARARSPAPLRGATANKGGKCYAAAKLGTPLCCIGIAYAVKEGLVLAHG